MGRDEADVGEGVHAEEAERALGVLEFDVAEEEFLGVRGVFIVAQEGGGDDGEFGFESGEL